MEKIKSEYWIQTYSNQRYDFVHNNVDDINILDIAHSLSQQVRFTGHLKRPLSIAQHSLTVAACLKKDGKSNEVCLQGLMHDAHEAYTGDWSSPYKRFLLDKLGIDIEEIEAPIKNAIGLKFDIDLLNLPSIIHRYDEAVMRTEAESLFDRPVDNWTKKIKNKLQNNIKEVLGCKEANELFIKTFKDLKGRIN